MNDLGSMSDDKLFSEHDFLMVSVKPSEQYILMSRVDQMLCDEAEHGRIHGEGFLLNGCWISANGKTRMRLNCGNFIGEPSYLAFPSQRSQLAYLQHGEPLIEVLCGNHEPLPINGQGIRRNSSFPCFPYLTMAFLTSYIQNNDLLPYAKILAAKSNLDGLWGSRNSIRNDSNWHENLYFNDAFSDVFTEKQTICNSDGIPTDIVLYSIAGEYISVLPVKQLCRADFPSCRTVYFPPDKIYPVQFGQNDHDIAYLSMSWPKGNLPSDVFWCSYPGGASTVPKMDLSFFRRFRKRMIVFIERQGIEGINFAMSLASRLRRENVDFSIHRLAGCSFSELSLSEFRTVIKKNGFLIPEELSSTYRGDITNLIEKSADALIPGILDQGDCLAFLCDVPIDSGFLLFLLRNLYQGCWDKRWEKIDPCSLIRVWIDSADIRFWKRTEFQSEQVHFLIGNTSFEDFKLNVQKANLAILASSSLLADSTLVNKCVDYCFEHEIAVIVIGTYSEMKVQREKIVSTYRLQQTQNDAWNTITIASAENDFGIKFNLGKDGEVSAIEDLPDGKITVLDAPDERMSNNGFEDAHNILSKLSLERKTEMAREKLLKDP